MIIVRTPHRVSLFGGGTDFPGWYLRNGGAVIGGAIDKYCYLTVRELPPFFSHRYRIVYSRIETVSRAEDIRHPVVRQAIVSSSLSTGLEIHHDSDLPARTGIGSSSSFAVGLIHALSMLQNQELSANDLSLAAIRLEREELREPGGHQDQVLCAHGGLRRVTFDSTGGITTHGPYLAAAHVSKWLLLVYAGTKRLSSNIAAAFEERLDHGENDKHLARLFTITERASYIFAESTAPDMEEIAELLDLSWELKSRMNPLAVPEDLEQLRTRARDAGALGGKISGAGGGGFCMFVVDPEHHMAFIEKMKPLLVVPFAFSESGSEVLYPKLDTGPKS